MFALLSGSHGYHGVSGGHGEGVVMLVIYSDSLPEACIFDESVGDCAKNSFVGHLKVRDGTVSAFLLHIEDELLLDKGNVRAIFGEGSDGDGSSSGGRAGEVDLIQALEPAVINSTRENKIG